MKRKFKVDDRVKCIGNVHCDNSAIKGKIGTIKAIKEGEFLPLGVEFDTDISHGHVLDGLSENRRGWWVTEKDLELIPSEKIVIYRKDNEVIAKDVNTGKIGVAKCDPRDEFKFEIGAKLALERLSSNVTFKFLCVRDYPASFTEGKVYEVINGIFTHDCGMKSNKYYSFERFINLNPYYEGYVVEIKDGDDVYEILKRYKTIKKGDYWSRVCEIQKRQTDKGLKKYGQVLEDTQDMDISTRLNHIEEELIDALMYIEHLKEISR